MNSSRLVLASGLFLLLSPLSAPAQTSPPFDVQAYEGFLAAHSNMSSDGLMSLHPAGKFAVRAPVSIDAMPGLQQIDNCYALTPYERSLLADHGFVVTDRLRYPSPGQALFEIYNRDLPVFVSADAILHSVHASYDAILMEAESQLLIGKLDTLLTAMRGQLPSISGAYTSKPGMLTMIHDVDIYLTVAYALLTGSATCTFPGDAQRVATLENYVAAQQMVADTLFSSTPRYIDFSQFTVRGHYTESPELGRYFQSMMWLGRTELYILGPGGTDFQQFSVDIQRQTIDAALLVESLDRANAFPLLEQIDAVIRMFVGESDNVTLPNMKTLLQEAGVGSADRLLDTLVVSALQDTLWKKPFAFQRINSQILASSNLFKPDNIRPASSVLLLGQRFVVDSYVTGDVVFDRINYQGIAVWRALPSTLDVLFALGNDAAAQLLVPELDQYHYASNLAALRYLIDGYDASYWTSSMFNGWLAMIRACNPPPDRSALPPFMTTASWWQEKINTQLASWAELRHDNLLYAKESYTGMGTCSFPKSYVEPIPALFDAVRAYAKAGRDRLVPLLSVRTPQTWLASYFSFVDGVADTLGSVARKELIGQPLSADETRFLSQMLFQKDGGCTKVMDGWYYHLYYESNGYSKMDYLVADVHTCPSDASGNIVGWVLHVGTGPVNMGIVVAPVDCGMAAFIGPVMSYREHVTNNFLRLTDAQWGSTFALDEISRPSFVNAYLADGTGATRGAGATLLTGIEQQYTAPLPGSPVLYQNYPNPFNPETLVRYALPARSDVTLAVYNTLGQRVAVLVRETQDRGIHQVRFDGAGLASGVYFYRLQAGASVSTNRMVLLR